MHFINLSGYLAASVQLNQLTLIYVEAQIASGGHHLLLLTVSVALVQRISGTTAFQCTWPTFYIAGQTWRHIVLPRTKT